MVPPAKPRLKLGVPQFAGHVVHSGLDAVPQEHVAHVQVVVGVQLAALANGRGDALGQGSALNLELGPVLLVVDVEHGVLDVGEHALGRVVHHPVGVVMGRVHAHNFILQYIKRPSVKRQQHGLRRTNAVLVVIENSKFAVIDCSWPILQSLQVIDDISVLLNKGRKIAVRLKCTYDGQSLLQNGKSAVVPLLHDPEHGVLDLDVGTLGKNVPNDVVVQIAASARIIFNVINRLD